MGECDDSDKKKKMSDVTFPDAFLKRWLLSANKDLTETKLEEDYPKILDDLKWHLAKDKLAKAYDVKVESPDVEAYAKEMARAQFAQYGMMNVEDDLLDHYAKDMLKKAKDMGKEILLPVDTVVCAAFPDPIDAPVETKIVPSMEIPADMMGLDIGTKTRTLFAEKVKSAKTVIWNGPMGVFENPTLAAGTIAVAQAMADAQGATTIVGGGDSAAACKTLGFADKITHISTGGGASLELFEGKKLPGIECLNEKN